MNVLAGRGIGFKSRSEQIDTTTSGGKLVFHIFIFGALAEFERELIREQTRAGLAAARARGRQGGRPKKLDSPKKVAMAQALYEPIFRGDPVALGGAQLFDRAGSRLPRPVYRARRCRFPRPAGAV